MEKSKTWIKLFRAIDDWEWRGSASHFSVYMFCLTSASHCKLKKFGITIPEGGFTTTVGKIAGVVGLSSTRIKQVLNDLEKTGYIRKKRVRNFSLVTVVGYGGFAILGNEVGHNNTTKVSNLVSNKVPSCIDTGIDVGIDEGMTTNQELKELKEYISSNKFDFDAVYSLYPRKAGKKLGLKRCKSQIKTQNKYNKLLTAVKNYSLICQKNCTDKQYIKQFSTFMNCWEDYIEIEDDPSLTADDRLLEMLGDPTSEEVWDCLNSSEVE